MPDLDAELLERVARWCADAGRTTVFGDGTTGNTVPVTGTGYYVGPPPGAVTIYGRVALANAATAPVGSYTDTVQITIVF